MTTMPENPLHIHKRLALMLFRTFFDHGCDFPFIDMPGRYDHRPLRQAALVVLVAVPAVMVRAVPMLLGQCGRFAFIPVSKVDVKHVGTFRTRDGRD